MPVGTDVTVPAPATATDTVKVCAKFAVTDVLEVTVTTHVPVPEQPFDQPVKTEPAFAVAVSVTCVPSSNSAPQSSVQLRPAGLDVTMPAPAPVKLTDSVS